MNTERKVLVWLVVTFSQKNTNNMNINTLYIKLIQVDYEQDITLNCINKIIYKYNVIMANKHLTDVGKL